MAEKKLNGTVIVTYSCMEYNASMHPIANSVVMPLKKNN